MLGILLAASLTMVLGDGCGHGYSSYGYNSYGGYSGYQSSYGNWSYSYYYKPGYTYYYASYGYPAGYYYYNQPQYIYKPYYVPVAFSTYQTAAVASVPLAMVEQRTLVQATGTGVAAMPAQPVVIAGTLANVIPTVQQSVGVAGPVQGMSACDKLIAAMDARHEARMARIEKALGVPQDDRIPSPPQDKPQPKAQAPADQNAALAALVAKGKTAFVNSCAKCHSKPGDAKSPQLFNGKEIAALDSKTLLACYRDILSGRMPKEGKLMQDDGQSIMAYLESITASDAAKVEPMPPAK